MEQILLNVPIRTNPRVGLSGSGNFIPGKYLKYVIIAFVLAAIGNTIAGYLLQSLSDMREQLHDLDTRVAVMDARVSYLTTVQANTRAMQDNNGGGGGFNAAENNLTTTTGEK